MQIPKRSLFDQNDDPASLALPVSHYQRKLNFFLESEGPSSFPSQSNAPNADPTLAKRADF